MRLEEAPVNNIKSKDRVSTTMPASVGLWDA